MSKDLKEAKLKEVQKDMRTMSHQIEYMNKELETIFKKQMEILELKCTILKI